MFFLFWFLCVTELDSNLLLTSGEDHKGIIWSGSKGEPLHEIEFGTPNFEVNWSPLRAGSLACSSLDGRISVYNINDACPKYLGRDSGISFGFGGKIISFGKKFSTQDSPADSMGGGGATPRESSNPKIKKKTKLLPPSIDVEFLIKEPRMVERAQTFQKILNSLRDVEGSMQFAENKIRDLEHITENKESMEEFDKGDERNELNKDRLTWNLARLMYDFTPSNNNNNKNNRNQNQNQNQNQTNSDLDEYREQMLNFLGYEKQEVEDAFNAQS